MSYRPAPFDPYEASRNALTDDTLCAGCGRFTCNNPECGCGPMREMELDNRQSGDLDLADMAREAADAQGIDRLAEQMTLKRVVRWLDGQAVES